MKDEQFWDHIFEQIAEGVNLPALAAGAQIPYRTLHENITKDPIRNQKYEQAIKKAGGFYFLIRSLDEAIQAIDSIKHLTEIDCGRIT